MKLEEPSGPNDDTPSFVGILDDHELCWMYYPPSTNGSRSADDKIILGEFTLDFSEGDWNMTDDALLYLVDDNSGQNYYCGYSANSVDFVGDMESIYIAGTRHIEGSELTRIDDLFMGVAPGDCFSGGNNFHYNSNMTLLDDAVGTSQYYEGISLAYGNRGFAAGGVLEESLPYGYFAVGTKGRYLKPGSTEIYVAFMELEDGDDSGNFQENMNPAGSGGSLESAYLPGANEILLSLSLGETYSGTVTLSFYDITGRCVNTLQQEASQQNVIEVCFDGTNNNGQPLAAGIYACRAEWDGYSTTSSFAVIH